MSDNKSNDSIQTNKNDNRTPRGSIMRINSQRHNLLLSASSRISQSSLDIKSVSDNSKQSHRFAQIGKKLVKIINVTKIIQNGKQSPLKEDTNESQNSSDYDFIRKIDETDIPNKPRFPSTMSCEAQYSYLKGYQDLILKSLNSTILTKIDSTNLTSSLPKIEDDMYLHYEPKIKIKNNQLGFMPYSSNQKCNNNRLPTPVQQLCTSYRLQNAMDILDHINDSNGKSTFSFHFKRHNINPNKHFLIWEKVWKKDFEVKNRF